MSKEPNENSVDYWKEKFENLSSRLAAVERDSSKPTTFQQISAAVEQAAQQLFISPRMNDLFMGKIRDMNVRQRDVQEWIVNEAKRSVNDWIVSSGQQLVETAVIGNERINPIITRNIQSILADRTVTTALAEAFRGNLLNNKEQLDAVVTELAKDDKGLLAKALAANQVFMDRQTQTLLTHLRDALLSE